MDPSGNRPCDEERGCGDTPVDEFLLKLGRSYEGDWDPEAQKEAAKKLERAFQAGEFLITILWEPADWAVTATECINGECSPLALLGLLPLLPASKADEIVALLPALKIHNHHIFPKQFVDFFEAVGIRIDEHTIQLFEGVHLKGVHGKGGFVGPLDKMLPSTKWNEAWADFFENNPNANTKEIYQFAGQLMDQFGLSGLPIIPYK